MHLRSKALLVRLCPPFVVRRHLVARYEREIAEHGEPELPELPRLVSKGQLALDVGANQGVYSYALGQLTGNVIAFEPNPALASILRHAALAGVKVRAIALSGRDEEAELVVPEVVGGHGLGSLRSGMHDDVEREQIKVAAARLDSLGIVGVSFIKVDVEGFEEEMLEGAVDTIRRDRPIMLIEIEDRHNLGGVERINTKLAALGYTALFFWDGRWRHFNDFDMAIHQDPSQLFGTRRSARYSNNFLFLPTLAQAEALL